MSNNSDDWPKKHGDGPEDKWGDDGGGVSSERGAKASNPENEAKQQQQLQPPDVEQVQVQVQPQPPQLAQHSLAPPPPPQQQQQRPPAPQQSTPVTQPPPQWHPHQPPHPSAPPTPTHHPSALFYVPMYPPTGESSAYPPPRGYETPVVSPLMTTPPHPMAAVPYGGPHVGSYAAAHMYSPYPPPMYPYPQLPPHYYPTPETPLRTSYPPAAATASPYYTPPPPPAQGYESPPTEAVSAEASASTATEDDDYSKDLEENHNNNSRLKMYIKPRLPTTPEASDRRARKNADARARAATLRDRIIEIEKKSDADRTDEERQMLIQYECRRKRKNDRSRERALERKEEIERILAKPEQKRTKIEKQYLETALCAKKRKNEGDRNRRRRMKYEPPASYATYASEAARLGQGSSAQQNGGHAAPMVSFY